MDLMNQQIDQQIEFVHNSQYGSDFGFNLKKFIEKVAKIF